jgi:hypothetical protein
MSNQNVYKRDPQGNVTRLPSDDPNDPSQQSLQAKQPIVQLAADKAQTRQAEQSEPTGNEYVDPQHPKNQPSKTPVPSYRQDNTSAPIRPVN